MSEQPETKKNRQYLRKWKITIYKPAYITNEDGQQERDPEHDVEMDVSQLRCVFKVQMHETSAFTLGTLVVYNMSITTEKEVIEEGFQIRIEGGYQDAQYGEIFTGDILQIFRNREDGVDYRLEIIAMSGSRELYTNFVKAKFAAGSRPRDLPKQIADNAKLKMKVGPVSNNLTDQPLPRGKVLYGTPAKYLRNQSVEQDASFYVNESGELEVDKFSDDIPSDMVLYLTPETGLVGTPVYGDDGIRIKMLLDARVKRRTMIKIDNSIVRRQAAAFSTNAGAKNGSGDQNMVFDQDGEYCAFSVTHSGDTWGDDWTTEVIGVGRNGRQGVYSCLSSKNQNFR